MLDMQQLLPFDGWANLLAQFVEDFVLLSSANLDIPDKRLYKVASSPEPLGVVRSARKAAFARLSNRKDILKYAFDARRTDQDLDRNPRGNLQYYNRSQQYIDENDQKRLESFARLIAPLEAIKSKFGTKHEYFNSYSRKLHDDVRSVLRVKTSDSDIFRPQMDYLEQLLYARYRLTKEDLEKNSAEQLIEVILSKDEDLLKRGTFMHVTKEDYESYLDKRYPDQIQSKSAPEANSEKISKDSNALTQDSIVNAIFGNNQFRRVDEKVVERTVTITIRDQVID